MKKIVSIVLSGAMILSLGGIAFASSFDSPGEILANLTGKTVEKVYEEKGDKTFGQLADEEGVLKDFREQMLESKKAIIAQRVEEGVLTQEEADEILEQMDQQDCTLNPEESKKLGQKYNVRFQFGKNSEFQGQGLGKGQGRGQGLGKGQGQGQGFRWNN